MEETAKEGEMLMNGGGGAGNDDITNPSFCDDILCDILSRLRVKSLVRFKCVCKGWRSLIQSPRFVELHLSRSKPPSLSITSTNESHTNFFLVGDLLEAETAVHTLKIKHCNTLLSSVNGLFCITRTRFSAAPVARFYNPSTRQITPPIRQALPLKTEKGIRRPQYGFGFDPATKEHKVICVSEILDEKLIGKGYVVCDVLTVGKDNVWRRINEVPPYLFHGSGIDHGIYANGSIYWRNLANCMQPREHEVIVAFDVGSEKFRVIHVPDFILLEISPTYRMYFHLMMEVDGCITLLDKKSDYEVKLWKYDDAEKTATNNNTNTRNNWTEETILLPFSWNHNVWIISLYAIAGTDLIIIHGPGSRPEFDSERPRRRYVCPYYYDRKKKTSGKLNITGCSLFMNALHIANIKPFVESLCPVYIQQQDHTQQVSTETRKERLDEFRNYVSISGFG